jgi:hypothetical protein
MGLRVLGRRPDLYLPFSRWRYGDDLTFGPATQIVIEGFPRSANSFAVNAFRLAQPTPVAIAHHLHAPAQVIAATRTGIPAVVLVREPRDAIVSYVQWQPHVGVRQAARQYLSFYRSVEPYTDMCVVADFAQVTGDYGAVIERINRMFGTSFARFEHSDENVRRCFEAIEQISREQRGELVESAVARPSAHRRSVKVDVEREFLDRCPPATLAELDAIYADYRALAHRNGR